jgi:hypothetical protein
VIINGAITICCFLNCHVIGVSSGMMVPVQGTRAMPPGEGVKKGRKAKPDEYPETRGVGGAPQMSWLIVNLTSYSP